MMHCRIVISLLLISLVYGRLMDLQERSNEKENSGVVSLQMNENINDNSLQRDLKSHYETTVCYDFVDKHICLGNITFGENDHVVEVTTQTDRSFDPHAASSTTANTCWATYHQVPCRYCRTCGNHIGKMVLDCSNVITDSSCSRINCDGSCQTTSRGTVFISELAAFKHAMLASAMLSVIVMAAVRYLFQACCKQQHEQYLVASTDFEDSYPPDQEPTEDRKELIEASLLRKDIPLIEIRRFHTNDSRSDNSEFFDGDDEDSNTAESSRSQRRNYTMLSTSDKSAGSKIDSQQQQFRQQQQQQQVCHVCLEPLICDAAESKVSNCSHAFHYKCIVKWLQRHDDCPCCRSKFLMVQEP